MPIQPHRRVGFARLGGSPRDQVFGVELDARVHQEITNKLHQEFAITPGTLAEKAGSMIAESDETMRQLLEAVALTTNALVRYRWFDSYFTAAATIDEKARK